MENFLKNNNNNEFNHANFFYPEEKLAVFIDGANLYAAAKNLEFDIDYKRLLRWISAQSRLVRAFYYTALLEDQEYSPIRPLIDWLDYNGYTMINKTAKEFTDQTGRRKIKGNMDIELAIDMMELAGHVDHIVLFSGDGDFRRLYKSAPRAASRRWSPTDFAVRPITLSIWLIWQNSSNARMSATRQPMLFPLKYM